MEQQKIFQNRKNWRRLVKKLRRKRIRQKLAKIREEKQQEVEKQLKSDPSYQESIREQEILEQMKNEIEEREHDKNEIEWMRRELLAQKQFRENQKRKEAIEKSREEERQKIQIEFEKMQELAKKRIEEKKHFIELEKRKHEILLQKIKEYVELGGDIPQELECIAETNPGKLSCPFFIKTAACRFGDACVRNHIRPGIKYGDLTLEISDSELYDDYLTFYNDVIPELKKFGNIENFRTCCNSEAHLRGNVYVEYSNQRDAMQAYLNLQGRYFAQKRINVEFCSIISWKAATCAEKNKCHKGKNCNFLHFFKNPGQQYSQGDKNTNISTKNTTSKISTDFRNECWNNCNEKKRNWRWSESPENTLWKKQKISPRSEKQSKETKRSKNNKSSKTPVDFPSKSCDTFNKEKKNALIISPKTNISHKQKSSPSYKKHSKKTKRGRSKCHKSERKKSKKRKHHSHKSHSKSKERRRNEIS